MRAWIAILVASGLLVTANARADVQSCLTASEEGQRARAAGKLRAAQDQFVICGSDTCPAVVRRDCAQWSAEVTQSLPTVVFGAKDKSGRDLFEVTVTIDGEMLVKKLDGKGVVVDPGRHAFTFEAAGLPRLTETALIKEGERPRLINVTFDGGAGTEPPPATPKRRPHTIYPWILVGVGAAALVAGTVISVTAPDRPSNCEKTTSLCTPRPGQSPEDFTNDRDTAGRADGQPLVGFVTIGVGAALAIGGLVWHFLEPTTTTTSSARPTTLRFEF